MEILANIVALFVWLVCLDAIMDGIISDLIFPFKIKYDSNGTSYVDERGGTTVDVNRLLQKEDVRATLKRMHEFAIKHNIPSIPD